MVTKIEKHDHIEPDKLQIYFLRIREFAVRHKKRIYAGGATLALVLLIACGWYLYQSNYEAASGRALTVIIDAHSKAGSPAGDDEAIKKYKELISGYSRSQAAVTASFRLGNLYLGRRDYDAAILSYQEFISKADSNSDLITLTYAGIGACEEGKNNFSKALEAYDSAIKSTAANSFEALNLSNMARIYEKQNDSSKAAEYYRKALDKTTDPFMGMYFKRKLALLG